MLPGGDIAVGGFFEGSTTIGEATDPNLRTFVAPGSGADGFVARFSQSAALRWVTTVGSPSAVLCLSSDPAGLFVAGSIDMNGPATAAGLAIPFSQTGVDVLVMLLDPATGAGVWARTAGGTSSDFDWPRGMASSGDGTVYIAGQFQSPVVTLGKGEVRETSLQRTSSDPDVFVARYAATPR